MKILHLGKYYPPYAGGIEAYCKTICEGLVSKGHEVDIVVANNLNQFVMERINGVNIFRLPRKAVLGSIPICPTMPFFVRKLVKENNHDAIHLHYPNPMAEMSYFFGCRNMKLIITYHTDASTKYRAKLLYLLASKLLLRCAKHIIVTSKSYLESRDALIGYINKCQIIPIPVSSPFLLPIDVNGVAEIKRKYGVFILFVGNLSSYKGSHYLIEAMVNIKCNLVMVGIGADNSITEFIKKLGLENRIYFPGKVEEKELINFYDSCELFCLPSVSPMETFGIVLLEAMARGKPVISTELGTGTSWVNQNGETGLVVKPKSSKVLSAAINHVLQNDDIRLRMSNNAQKRVIEGFTIDKIISSIIDAYIN